MLGWFFDTARGGPVGRLAPWMAAVMVGAAVCAGCADGPRDLHFKGYLLTIPPTFETEREGQGPHQSLILVTPEQTVACRLVVIRDSRRFGDTDARAFLATGRSRYGGAEEVPVSLETVDGPLDGWARSGIEVPPAWGLRPRSGAPHLEVYAAGRGTELVGMMIAWYAGDAHALRRVDACRRTLATLRR